jgi:hypothetical protein
METRKGRKPIPADERKIAIRIYVAAGDIKKLGGQLSVIDLLTDYFNSKLKKS